MARGSQDAGSRNLVLTFMRTTIILSPQVCKVIALLSIAERRVPPDDRGADVLAGGDDGADPLLGAGRPLSAAHRPRVEARQVPQPPLRPRALRAQDRQPSGRKKTTG